MYKNSELRGKSIPEVHNHMAKSNKKTHQKRMDKNCHIPDLVQAFSNVENGGLNLFLKHLNPLQLFEPALSQESDVL